MKQELHPNWTSTGAHGEQGNDGDASPHRIPVQSAVSRAPLIGAAVFVGIVVTSLLGYVFIGGVQLLRADIVADSVVVPPQPESLKPVIPPQSETVDLGMAATKPTAPATVPSLLRANRFTIGSGLFPDLSRMIAVPLTRSAAHGAADNRTSPAAQNLPPRAPATGPSLWILAVLSLCVMPVYWMRRKVR